MKVTTQKQKVQKEIIDVHTEVLHDLQISEEEHFDLIFELGYEFLSKILVPGTKYFNDVISSKPYWGWFKLEVLNAQISWLKQARTLITSNSIANVKLELYKTKLRMRILENPNTIPSFDEWLKLFLKSQKIK